MKSPTDSPASDPDVGPAEPVAELKTELAKLGSVGAATILSQLAEGVIITDVEGRITFVNEAAERLHGRMELGVGPDGYSDAYELLTEDGEPYPPGDLPLARAVLHGETVENARWRIRRPDGREVLAIGNARPMTSGDGTQIGAVLTLRDDTARGTAEAALRANEEFSRRVLASSPDCIKVLSLDGRLEFMTDGGMCVMEVDDFADIKGAQWPEVWQGEERSKAIAALEDAQKGRTARFQGFATTFKGTPRWWDVTVSPINGRDGCPEKLLSVSRDITPIMEAGAVLRESEERVRQASRRLDAILANTRMAVFLMDERQHCAYANAAAELMTGYAFADMKGRPLHDVIHHKKPDGSHYPLEECPIDRAFPERAQMSGEELFVAPDGSFYPVAFTASPVINEDGQTIGTVIEARNIAEEKARDAALKESEAQFRLMADVVPQIVWVTDAEGKVEFFNKQWFDYVDSADLPKSAEDVAEHHLHADDEASTMAAFNEARRTGSTFQTEHRIRSAAGDYRWFLARGKPYRDPQTGKVVRWFGTSVDIDDRRLAEEALRDSETRLSFLDRLGAETAPLIDADAVLATTTRLLGEHLKLSVCAYADMDEDQDGFTIRGDWAAPGSTSIVGHYSLADFGKLAVTNLSAGLPLVVNDNLRELAPEEAATFQSIGIAATICMPLVKEGRLTALMAIHDRVPREWTDAELSLLREVTSRSWAHVERVAAAEELRASEARLRELNDTLEEQVAERSKALRLFKNIVQSDRSPVCAFDRDYRLIAFNRAHNDEFRRVNGFPSKVGDIFPDLFVPEQRPIMRELMSRALSGERFTVVEEFGRPDLGKPYWEITYTPLRDEAGEIIGAFHHAKDVSSRVQAEAELAQTHEALRQSQKLESMGQLTGGVAHDFNNLLTPIIGSLDMLVRKGLGSERERRLIDGALQSAERAKTLVQRLLAFARRQPLQPTAVDLTKLISEMAGLVSSTLGPNIDVQVELAENVPAANADLNQLEMALLNLAVNARDAMPEGGVLTIAARSETVAAAHRTKLPAGDYVVLCVADTGAGMDEETRARAVEPFFSTKGVGKGTGLGLSMVHGLAGQLGGGLMIDSRVGRGTTIELWLPMSRATAGAEEVETAPLKRSQRRGSALLVDDEELVRMSTADMLIDLGFEVIEAACAEEALRIVEGGVVPDILVTDHLMPGMNGADLARALHTLVPALPVLIVSGYAEVGGISADFARLTKPFRNAELAASLDGLLQDGANKAPGAGNGHTVSSAGAKPHSGRIN